MAPTVSSLAADLQRAIIVNALLNAVILGMETGAFYALIALGLNVVFATTGIYNFAQGDLTALATVGALLLLQSVHMPLWVALVLAVVAAAVVSMTMDFIAVRSAMRLGDASGWVLSLLGVSVVASGVGTMAITHESAGSSILLFPSLVPFSDSYRWAALTISPDRLLVVVAMVVCATGLIQFTRRTAYGRALQALSDDVEGARMRGLPVGRLKALSFGIAGIIAGLAGVVIGPVSGVAAGLGIAYTLNGFIAATLGGLPSYVGAVVGGLALGVVERLTALYTDGSYNSVVTLGLLLVVLLLRPQGLFGRVGRVA